MKLRKLGGDGRSCCNKLDCPNVFEMEDGNFAIVGIDRTAAIRGFLPNDAGCGPGESVVTIPRSVMLAAVRDIGT